MSRARIIPRATITSMLYVNRPYFTADLSDGGVRIGTDSRCFDIPRGHAWGQRVREASTLAEVTDLFHELSEAFA